MARRRAYLGGRRAAYKGCGSAPPLGPRSAIIRAEAARPRPIVPLPTHQLLAPPRRPPAVSWSRRSHRARRCCPPAPAAAPSRTQGRETARQRTPPDAARGVPAASRPRPWGRLQCPLRGQAPPPTAGSACGRAAATPAVGRWVRGLSCGRPAPSGTRAPAGLRQLPSGACIARTYRQLCVGCYLTHPPCPLWSAKSRHKPFGNKIHP